MLRNDKSMKSEIKVTKIVSVGEEILCKFLIGKILSDIQKIFWQVKKNKKELRYQEGYPKFFSDVLSG